MLGGIHMTNLAYLPNALLKGTQVSLRLYSEKNIQMLYSQRQMLSSKRSPPPSTGGASPPFTTTTLPSKTSMNSRYNEEQMFLSHFAKPCPQMMVYNLDTKPFWKSLVDKIETVEDISKKLPWFLECNPDRFPYWWVKYPQIIKLLFHPYLWAG